MRGVEAVEKPFSRAHVSLPGDVIVWQGVFFVSVRGGLESVSLGHLNPHSLGSLRITVMRQLLDVVHQAVELPLRVDLVPASKREAVKALVVP